MNSIKKLRAFLMREITRKMPENKKQQILETFKTKKKMGYNPENNNALDVAKGGSQMETVQRRVPMKLANATSISLTFDYREATEEDGEVSIIIGDTCDLMKLKNSDLQKINAKLKINGYYGKKSIDALNNFAKSVFVRMKEMQTQANSPEFYTTKQPLQLLRGMYGQTPQGVNYDFQQNVSPADQNLVARLDKDFSFDLTAITAMQFVLSPGDLVTYTFKLYQVGIGALTELV